MIRPNHTDGSERQEQRAMSNTARVAIVTGATSGLGAEIAAVLAEQTWVVAVLGRHRVRGEAVTERIRTAGGQAVFVACDVSTSHGCDAAVSRVVADVGVPDVLVNNVYASDAIADDAPAGEVSDDAWDAIVTGNLSSTLWMTRAALRPMVARGRGSIVNVSARAALVGTPGMAAHSATKGAINALTRSVAVDYARHGVRCNAVAPGHVLHAARDGAMSTERRASLEAMHLTRLATARDVALAVSFLAGDAAEVMTGVILPVDGGSTAARAATLGGPDPRFRDPEC